MSILWMQIFGRRSKKMMVEVEVTVEVKGKLDSMVAKLQSQGVENTPYEDKSW